MYFLLCFAADTDTFAVNMSDGRIILVKAPDRLEYIVAITATDYGAPPLSAEVNVTIQIDAGKLNLLFQEGSLVNKVLRHVFRLVNKGKTTSLTICLFS